MARRKLHDEYFRRAKAEGYAARSAYKLKQIQEKFGLLGAGSRVLDLGCAPGAWLQVASELVDPGGRVVGLDLKRVSIPLPSNVESFEGDARTFEASTLTDAAGGLFSAVVSDMAPDTTGHGDAERSIALCQDVLYRLPELLQPTGWVVMKVLEGSGYPELLNDTRGMFATARAYKPKASRDVSREMYVVGKGFVGAR